MATRICFVPNAKNDLLYESFLVDFKWYGIQFEDKKRSVLSLVESISKKDSSLRHLEISTKSNNPLGVALSAFNLSFLDRKSNKIYCVESVYQSSKVFQKGGPYKDLLDLPPWTAKKDGRLRSSGPIIGFNWKEIDYATKPMTFFYDWIYMKVLHFNKVLAKKVLDYNAFTDVEFLHYKNPEGACQARTVAMYVSLAKLGLLEDFLSNREKFKEIYTFQKKRIEVLPSLSKEKDSFLKENEFPAYYQTWLPLGEMSERTR